jgi:hypothetical protein
VRPGMFRVTMMFCFRDESLMLKFAGTIKVERGALNIAFHYDPMHAVIVEGVAEAADVSRILSSVADFPGITHASAELDTVLEASENTEVTV